MLGLILYLTIGVWLGVVAGELLIYYIHFREGKDGEKY